MFNYKSKQHIIRSTKSLKRMKDAKAINYMFSFYREAYRDGYADSAEEIMKAVESAIEKTPRIGKKIGETLRENIVLELENNQFIKVGR